MKAKEVHKLSDEEINKVEKALDDLNVTFMHLRKAIIDAGGGGRS